MDGCAGQLHDLRPGGAQLSRGVPAVPPDHQRHGEVLVRVADGRSSGGGALRGPQAVDVAGQARCCHQA
eukprot:7579942-Lingulodinium_polyedra.AAC.1